LKTRLKAASDGQAEALAAYGLPELNIAEIVGIDPKTPRKRYRHEFDN